MLDEVSRLEGKVDRLLRQTYSRLTPWQKTQVARHPAPAGPMPPTTSRG